MRKLLLAAMIFGGVSAEAGTVGWWRMEGTFGENAATVENAANPGTLDAGTDVKLYVDGETYATGTAPGAIPFQNSTDTLRLYAASNNGDNFQAFDLDEVRFTARVKEPEDFIAFGKHFDRPGFLLLFK